MSNYIDQQLEDLRSRLKEIRIAKKWLQEYRVNAPISVSAALGVFHNWLETQEERTIAMGKRIKSQTNGK